MTFVIVWTALMSPIQQPVQGTQLERFVRVLRAFRAPFSTSTRSLQFECYRGGQEVFHSVVHDGVCDCCDGSDEPDGCPDSCGKAMSDLADAAGVLLDKLSQQAEGKAALLARARAQWHHWRGLSATLRANLQQLTVLEALLEHRLEVERVVQDEAQREAAFNKRHALTVGIALGQPLRQAATEPPLTWPFGSGSGVPVSETLLPNASEAFVRAGAALSTSTLAKHVQGVGDAVQHRIQRKAHKLAPSWPSHVLSAAEAVSQGCTATIANAAFMRHCTVHHGGEEEPVMVPGAWIQGSQVQGSRVRLPPALVQRHIRPLSAAAALLNGTMPTVHGKPSLLGFLSALPGSGSVPVAALIKEAGALPAEAYAGCGSAWKTQGLAGSGPVDIARLVASVAAGDSGGRLLAEASMSAPTKHSGRRGRSAARKQGLLGGWLNGGTGGYKLPLLRVLQALGIVCMPLRWAVDAGVLAAKLLLWSVESYLPPAFREPPALPVAVVQLGSKVRKVTVRYGIEWALSVVWGTADVVWDVVFPPRDTSVVRPEIEALQIALSSTKSAQAHVRSALDEVDIIAQLSSSQRLSDGEAARLVLSIGSSTTLMGLSPSAPFSVADALLADNTSRNIPPLVHSATCPAFRDPSYEYEVCFGQRALQRDLSTGATVMLGQKPLQGKDQKQHRHGLGDDVHTVTQTALGHGTQQALTQLLTHDPETWHNGTACWGVGPRAVDLVMTCGEPPSDAHESLHPLGFLPPSSAVARLQSVAERQPCVYTAVLESHLFCTREQEQALAKLSQVDDH